jgi:hypothetical protein
VLIYRFSYIVPSERCTGASWIGSSIVKCFQVRVIRWVCLCVYVCVWGDSVHGLGAQCALQAVLQPYVSCVDFCHFVSNNENLDFGGGLVREAVGTSHGWLFPEAT